jgi:hypothetical protein
LLSRSTQELRESRRPDDGDEKTRPFAIGRLQCTVR